MRLWALATSSSSATNCSRESESGMLHRTSSRDGLAERFGKRALEPLEVTLEVTHETEESTTSRGGRPAAKTTPAYPQLRERIGA